MPGALRSNSPKEAASSTRASGAPRQKWRPAPKVTCGFSCRERSSVSGSVKRAGSRLAEPKSRATSEPRGMTVPSISMSSSTQRSNICNGVSYRISSSTAVGSSPWSARSAASCSGWRSSVHQPFTVVLTVASCPAFSSSTHVETISCSVSRSPSSWAAMSAEIRSAPGFPRRCAISPRRYAEKSRDARTAARAVSSDGLSSNIPQIAADQGRSGARSDSGMPSISAITATGSGSATAVSRSPPPCATKSSTSPVASRWTVGTSCSTVRGVNALETSRRIRVWSGGSRSSSPCPLSVSKGSCAAGGGVRPNSSCVKRCRYVRPSRRSRSSADTSA